MVERFNGRISELLQQTRFDSRADLETTLLNYLKLYNHHIPQRAIGARASIQTPNKWQQKKAELFARRVYDQTDWTSNLYYAGPGYKWPPRMNISSAEN